MKVILRVLYWIVLDWIILLPLKISMAIVWLIIGLNGAHKRYFTMKEYYYETVKYNPCLGLVNEWLLTGKLS